MQHRQRSLFTGLVMLFLVAGCMPAIGQDPPPDPPKPDEKIPKEEVIINKATFKLEVANDDAERAKGLMGRKKIDDDGGMLFVYRRAGQRSFWMKGCIIDIDLIFLDSKGKIVALHEMKPDPPQRDDEDDWEFDNRLKRYPSTFNAQYGIELKAGSIKKLKLERGQTIELDFRRLVREAR